MGRITIEAVQHPVAVQFGVSVEQLSKEGRSRPVVRSRQVAMYLARQLTGASYPQLGRRFGRRHHTTVMHSIRKVEEERRSDKALNLALEGALRLLEGESGMLMALPPIVYPVTLTT